MLRLPTGIGVIHSPFPHGCVHKFLTRIFAFRRTDLIIARKATSTISLEFQFQSGQGRTDGYLPSNHIGVTHLLEIRGCRL